MGTRWRGEMSSPVSRSTAAALMPLPPTSTPMATRRSPGSTCTPLVSPALSHSPAIGFLASLVAWAAILAVCFASGTSLLAALTAPPASDSWFTVVAPRGLAGRGRA